MGGIRMTEKARPQRYKDFVPLVFKGTTESAWLWHRKALALREAAKVLWSNYAPYAELVAAAVHVTTSKPPARSGARNKRIDQNMVVAKLGTGDIAIMLAGMALEAVVKAVLAEQGKLKVNGDRLKRKLADHALKQHFKRAGISVTDTQCRALDLFAQHVRWRGRYPAPVGAKELISEHGKGMEWQRGKREPDPVLWPEFLPLFKLAEKSLNRCNTSAK